MLFSFVIPAYNSEGTLGKCIDSILRQPYDDYEIIVINDGSTDDTQLIIEKYQGLDTRVNYLYQENSGQGTARTSGLSLAVGEYVWFVDSDDWLLPNVLPRLSSIIGQERPDVLLANFEYVFDNQASVPSSLVPPHLAGKTVSPTKDFRTFAAVSCWSTPPWRLISLRSHLLENSITFAKGVFYEDHPFAIHLMLTAQRVFVDPSITYGYYQRATSTTKTNDQKAFDFLTVRKICIDLFKRFNRYEALAPVVAGYILPFNFFTAHVDEPYQQEFIERLHDDMRADDYEFVEKHGDWNTKLFAKAIRRKDRSVIRRTLYTHRIRTRYSLAGARRLLGRIKGAIIRRAVENLHRLKQYMLKPMSHVGVDDNGRRFLKAGIGTRVCPIYIDVRVQIENRPYVIVGENSLIDGYYVFERGIGLITIGNKSSIGNGCKFICAQEEGIHVGNNVMLSWNCTLMDSNSHSLNPDIRANDAYDWKAGVDAGLIGAYKDWSQVESGPIYIEDNVWVGFECAILKGVRIGKGAVIGARSMVTSDVAPYCIFAGSPARFISYVPKKKWSWTEIIQAAQGNPEMDTVLRDAYIHRDLMGSLLRFMESDEFKHTLAEFKSSVPNAKSILDIGGAGGVMTIAFALSGYAVTLAEPSSDDIVGTSAAHKLLSLAADKFDASLPERVRIENISIERFAVAECYDIVYCRQVVHHFPDPAAQLRKINDLLNDGGAAFLVREHVIFDDVDMELFLQGHPFHHYTQSENAYRSEQYRQFIYDAGMSLIKEYKFAESPINYFPHSEEAVATLNEIQIAGRPYTYVAQKRIAA